MSAMNAAMAMSKAKDVLSARLPTLYNASATSATTAHFTPSRAAATLGKLPYET